MADDTKLKPGQTVTFFDANMEPCERADSKFAHISSEDDDEPDYWLEKPAESKDEPDREQ